MNRFFTNSSLRHAAALLFLISPAASCGNGGTDERDDVTNPLIEDQSTGKEDTGYLNMAGVETHVTLESDIEAPSYEIFDAPTNLAQFAVTDLRKRMEFYMELLAEDTATTDRVEWLVNGDWISTSAARSVDVKKLTHFRLPRVNAVILNRTAENLTAGQVFTAKVPAKPYSVMEDAGDSCAESDSHISLSQSVYWYLWEPEASGCKAALKDMTVTVDEVLPQNPPSYPEYDRLWEDKVLTVVLVYGELDDGTDIKKDYNWGNADRMVTWLENAGFAEEPDPPLGRRFGKTVGELKEVVDIYFPDVFGGLTDYANFANWQRAVSDHEVVIYLGHSVLGSGFAYDRAEYPSFYQIFLIGGCLGYEYYVRPVLAGKGGWEKVDAISSIVENLYTEMNPVSGAFMAKLFWGYEHEGKAKWQDIMAAINNKLGHAHFGVSGARGNCFTPEGSRCGAGQRFESAAATPIPDNDPQGIISTIEVPASIPIGALSVELDITHTYAGDLQVILSHGETDTILWNRAGGSQQDIRQSFTPAVFNGTDAAGSWKLRVTDQAAQDSGTLNKWVLVFTPQ